MELAITIGIILVVLLVLYFVCAALFMRFFMKRAVKTQDEFMNRPLGTLDRTDFPSRRRTRL